MSFRSGLRATPTIYKVAFSEAIAYRAEMIVWALSSSMPFVMLAMWSAVAADGPVGRFTAAGFGAYFLCTFIVRQLTGAWVAWQMNFEVRTGVMSMRLLRPVHPIWHFGVENAAYLPMRIAVSLPIAVILLVVLGRDAVSSSTLMWGMWLLAVVGAWWINFLASAAVGTLSLYMEQSIRVMDVWFLLYSLFSGYLIPVELFPGWIRPAIEWLPFRFIIDVPVQIMTGAVTVEEGAQLLLGQWTWVGVFLAVTLLLWKSGLKRFGAYGG